MPHFTISVHKVKTFVKSLNISLSMFRLPSAPDALPPQRGIRHYFIVQRTGFATIGIDPTSLERTIYNPFLTWVPILCILTLGGPMALLAIKSSDDLAKMANVTTPMWQAILSTSKFTIFMWNKMKLVQLVRKIWKWNLEANNKELHILVEENRYDYNVSLFYYISVLVTGTLALIAPFTVAGFYAWKGYNYFDSLDLPLKALYIPDPHISYFLYGFDFVWNVFAIYSVINGTLAIDTLFSWFMRNISAQFRIVNLRFAAAAEEAKVRLAYGNYTDDEFSKSLVECVRYHRNVIDLANQFDSVYRPLVFVKFVISCLQLASLAFQFSRGGELAVHIFNVSCLISVSTQLMLYCYGGQRIKDLSTSVDSTIYESFHWHDLSVKTKKMLLLVMMRAQKPCKLTGIFFVADLNLFVWVFRTAVSFLTMMISVDTSEA